MIYEGSFIDIGMFTWHHLGFCLSVVRFCNMKEEIQKLKNVARDISVRLYLCTHLRFNDCIQTNETESIWRNKKDA